MMTLKQAARVFDDTVFTDTFGSSTFKGKILPFTDNTRSGESARRRILDTAPESSIPTERTLSTDDEIFIVGGDNNDYYKGSLIRSKYPVIPVSEQFAIRNIGQVLSDSGGTTAVYMDESYIRRVVVEDQSDFFSGFNLFFPKIYSVVAGEIIYGGGNYYKARDASRIDETGFGVVESVSIVDPLSIVDVITYSDDIDTVTDSYPATTIPDVDIFSEHLRIDFDHEAYGFEPISEGDKAISFLKTQVATISVSDLVGSFKALAVTDNTTYWTIHGSKT